MQCQHSPILSDRIRLIHCEYAELGGHRNDSADNGRLNSELDRRRPLRAPTRFSSSDAPLFPSQRHITPESWLLVKGLYCGLHALLVATAKEPARIGAKSLFSTCLRKVPAHIIKEQRQADLEDPEHHVDISVLTYDDLEAFGSVSDRGWKPLREVVRAHGLQLLSNAVKEGLIDHSRARGLAIVCIKNEAYSEAEAIVQAMLSTMKPLSSPRDRKPKLFELGEQPALFTLYQLQYASKRCRFFYSQLARLFSQGIVPIEWVSSRDLVKHWNLALLSIRSSDQYSAEAMQLLRSVMLLNASDRCRKSDGKDALTKSATATQRTIDQLLRIMTASTAMNVNQGSVVNTLMSEILVLASTQSALADTAFGVTSRHVIMAAILCTGKLPQGARYFPSISAKDDCAKAAASFVCSVARCCWSVNHIQSFDYIQHLIATLSQHQLPNMEQNGIRHMLADIAISAAFEFSEATNDVDHVEWAVALEDKLHKRGYQTQRRTPSRLKTEKKIKNLRWEEGISEWVAKTPRNEPATKTASKSIINVSDDDCTDDDDDTLREDPHLQILPLCATKLNSRPDADIHAELHLKDEGKGHNFQSSFASRTSRNRGDKDDELSGIVSPQDRRKGRTREILGPSKVAARRRLTKAVKWLPKSGARDEHLSFRSDCNRTACSESEDELCGY